MLFNGSIPFAMDVAFDHETFPPSSFASSNAKVFIVANVSVVILLLGLLHH